jgi:hypothetical protein
MRSIFYNRKTYYFSALKIPDTAGFCTEKVFLGAREELSTNKIKLVLPPLPVNLLLIFMRFDKSLVFLFSGE